MITENSNVVFYFMKSLTSSSSCHSSQGGEQVSHNGFHGFGLMQNQPSCLQPLQADPNASRDFLGELCGEETSSYVPLTILYSCSKRNYLGQKSIISGTVSFKVTCSPLNCCSLPGGFTKEQLRLTAT